MNCNETKSVVCGATEKENKPINAINTAPETNGMVDENSENATVQEIRETGLDGDDVLSLPFAPLQRLCKEILNEMQHNSDGADIFCEEEKNDSEDEEEEKDKKKTQLQNNKKTGVRMSKEAIVNSGKCSSLFMLYILDWAQEIAKKHKRSTVMPNDVITALMQSQIFDEQTVNYLSKLYMTQLESNKKKAKSKAK